MNVLDLRREIVRLEDELRHARDQKRSAQAEVRITGRRMPPDAYATVWRRIHDLECMLEHARLDLAYAEESAAKRFIAVVRAEFPAVYEQVSVSMRTTR